MLLEPLKNLEVVAVVLEEGEEAQARTCPEVEDGSQLVEEEVEPWEHSEWLEAQIELEEVEVVMVVVALQLIMIGQM